MYTIERERVSGTDRRPSWDIEHNPSERTALISDEQGGAEDNSRFVAALQTSLDKIVKFYIKKENELYGLQDQLLIDMDDYQHKTNPDEIVSLQQQQPPQLSRSQERLPRRESFVEGRDSDMPPTVISQNVRDSDPEQLHPEQPAWTDTNELKRRTVDLFVLLSELKSFVALNQTAFAKILKKYDKITESNLKRVFIAQHVAPAYPFRTQTKQKLNDQIQQTERLYAALATDNDLDLAIADLKTHLREHIVWERNMVWRDMIGQERKKQTVGLEPSKPLTAHTPCGTLTVTRDQILTAFFLAASIAIFAVLLRVDLFGDIAQNRCFAILVFASIMWAAEVGIVLLPFRITAPHVG